MADQAALDEELLNLFQQTPSPQKPRKSSAQAKPASAQPITAHSPTPQPSSRQPPAQHQPASRSKKRSRSRKTSRWDDDDNDDNEVEVDEEDEDDDQDDNYGGSGNSKHRRKQHGFHPDLDEDVEDVDEDEEDSDAELRRELARGVDERELEGLSELQREALLAEREERRQQLMEKLEIKRRLRQVASGEQQRSQRRQPAKSKATAHKLEELKEKRSRQRPKLEYQDPAAQLLDESEEDDEVYLSRIRSTYSSATGTKDVTLTLPDLLTVQITRQQIAKWVHAPFFQDTVMGLFVRIILGSNQANRRVYRVAEIVDIVNYHRTYRLNDTYTNVALKLRHGRAEKIFLCDVISDSPFLEEEFSRWTKVILADKQRFPTRNQLQLRLRQLEDAKSHIFTNEEIDDMVRRKKRLIPYGNQNVTLELVKLRTELEAAETAQDADRIAELHCHIDELEALRSQGSWMEEEDIWAKLNAKNRLRNQQEVSKAELNSRQDRLRQLTENLSSKRKPSHEVRRVDRFARIKAAPVLITSMLPNDGQDSGETTPLTPADERRKSLVDLGDGTIIGATPDAAGVAGDAFDLLAQAEI